MRSRLTRLQEEVLAAFFTRERRFFLTGGAALAGFHLGHRTTLDLDLFTVEDVLDEAEAVLRDVARTIGGTVESLRTAPDFRRRVVRRGEEAVVIDLVRDRAPQVHSEKELAGHIVLDPADEILANKLCALLSRAEIRDLVDVMLLERHGLSLDDALTHAQQKDGGLTAAQLGYVLGQMSIPDDARVPAVAPQELRAYLDELRGRLARRAFPTSP